ncbi:uncharacterized protein LOC117107228 [Anneissia japonica]|uniref:uncharacterized protein LOC117107228 n=1 Tax=Anneissia japonica TaxID=1529436 RepID=UPI0014257749|nr:uncharacterized protein LOC117107228 [Anneissia japonica]XP_033104738.1 uncharacterized protein LOC117107228 [Anneissia japonica]XP_033104739.1 uncharacterized protein LOC117107228 [Anneissia japonica]
MSSARAIPKPSPHKSLWEEDDVLYTQRSTSKSLPVPIMKRDVVPVKKEQTLSQLDQQTWTEWKGFSKQLDELTNWLSDTVKQLDSWKMPSDNVFSLRVQLEKHLAFALQIETHQQEKEKVITSSKHFSGFTPLQPYLNQTINYIEMQWKGLKKQLQKQHKQIEEALTVAEMCISNGSLDIFEGDSLTYEQTQDVLDQIGLRLRSQKTSFKMSEELKVEGETESQLFGKGVGSGANSGLMDSGYGSSPDFEVLYEELNEWLEEMQGVLTETNKASVSHDRKEHMSKSYDSELQIHDITRSYLEDKAVCMKTSQQTSNAGDKMTNVNTKWQKLERSISCSESKVQDSNQLDNSAVNFEEETPVEKETSIGEIEEIFSKLKGWLTETECKLFAPESRRCLGDVTHLERRLDLHKAIQEEINDHSESVDTVLALCDALQEDNDSGATEREKEHLQLAAINLERRWDAIQSQSIDLQCGLDEKLRVFKGVFSAKITKDPLEKSSSENSMKDDAETSATSILIAPSKFYGTPRAYRPTKSQDDVAIYRSNEKYTSPYAVNYDEILMIREAFSENDAFSISDISDVAEDDFEFDDVLPLKRSEMSKELSSDEEGDLDIKDLSTCSPIVTIPRRCSPTVEGSTSDVEFWSVSPKDENMLDGLRRNEVQPKIIKAKQSDPIADFEVLEEFDSMTDASQDSFNNVFILPLFNPDEDNDLMADDEEILSMISDFEADMENAVENVKADHLIAEIKEVFPIEAETECSTVIERSSYKVPCFTYTESSPNTNNNNNKDEDSSSDEENEVMMTNEPVLTNQEQSDEVNMFDICPSHAGTKGDAGLDRSKCDCSGDESPESKSFRCSKGTPATVYHNLTVSPDIAREPQEIKGFKCPAFDPLSIKSRNVSDMRRRFSSSSTTKHDDLMEISDISLVHMIESVDHATLLANSLCHFGRNTTTVEGTDSIPQSEDRSCEPTSNDTEKASVELEQKESDVEDQIKGGEKQQNQNVAEEEDEDFDSVCTTDTSELLEALEDVMDELAQLGNEQVGDLDLEPLITDVYCSHQSVDLRSKDCFGNSSAYSQTDSMDSGIFTGNETCTESTSTLPSLEEMTNEQGTPENDGINEDDVNYEIEEDEIDRDVNEEDLISEVEEPVDEDFDQYKYDDTSSKESTPGYMPLARRVVKYALPIQILLSVYMILILVIPAVIETSGWECSLSINNKAFFESLAWNPVLKYIKGPPPM